MASKNPPKKAAPPAYTILPLHPLHASYKMKPVMPHPGAYKSTLTRFPNLHAAPPRRSVQTNLFNTAKITMLNSPFPDAGPFYMPSHVGKLFTPKQITAIESLFRQCETQLQTEHGEYEARVKAANERRAAKKQIEVDEESVVTGTASQVDDNSVDNNAVSTGIESYKLEDTEKDKRGEKDMYDSDSDGSDDESVLCSPDSQPAEEAFEDEFSDDDTTYTRVRQPPPEPSLTIYSAVFKCPLPPCCINETCSAFSKTHVTKSVIPKHVQDEWDQLEAAKLASIYGSVAAPAEDSEDEEDVAANIDYTSELDFGPSKTPVRYLPQLFKSVGEDVNSKTLRKLNKALDTDGNGGVKFADFVTWLYNLRLSRRKWGNRACITDDLPLPRCCNNPACKAHSERPTASDDDEEEERQHHIMWSVFTRHDSDGSGELGLDEVRAIFVEHSFPFDEKKLHATFGQFDLDGSGHLEFEEFCELMEKLDATTQIVTKRTDAYALPDHMKEWFNKEKLEDLKTQFGIFDDSGDGNISAQELRAVLASLGTELSHEKVVDIIDTIDADKSGEIEFPEFVTLMRKIEKGEIDIGDSALTQAIMSSKSAVRLQNEVNGLCDDPIAGVIVKKLKKPLKPPTCEVHIEGPENTPYAGFMMVMRLAIPDDYPFSPPTVKFTHRILHINVSMLLDGSCSIPQISGLWDGGWDLRMLIGYVKALLKTPDTRLLPVSLREKYTLAGLPPGLDNDYGIDDAFDTDQKKKNELRGLKQMEEETEAAGFINPFKLEKQPYSDVVRSMLSKPEHDLRGGGLGDGGGSFLNRQVELYFERPAKFKAQAEAFCKRECKPISKFGAAVADDVVLFC